MVKQLQSIPPFVAVVGPTGSGKSHLALVLAERFGGEIINCDSVQIFRHFDIGTAKTPPSERRDIPHHLIDARNPDQVFTAGDYSRAARQILQEITSRDRLPILAGGTGFYLRALVEGLAPGPERDQSMRDRLAGREESRPGLLHRLLRRLDPQAASRIHANDLPKNIRAIEICYSARKPVQEVYSQGRDALEGYRVLKIGLFPDREKLYTRLEDRLEKMFADGIVGEVESILKRGFSETCKPFEAIGYKQALQIVKGESNYRDALFYARRDTRRYAKRQLTWFRQEPGLEFFSGFGDDPAVAFRVCERVEDFVEGPRQVDNV